MPNSNSKRLIENLFLSAIFFPIALGYGYRLYVGELSGKKTEYGLHGLEKWEIGKMAWTWKRARLIATASTDLVGIIVYNHPDMKSGKAGTPMKVFVDENEIDVINLQKGEFRGLYYHIPGISGREITLRFELQETFSPVKNGVKYDFRQLGVALSPPFFLEILPPEGIGFFGWEEWRETLPGHGFDAILKVRWTGRRASLPLDEGMKYGGSLFLKSLHPDCAQNPVGVTIWSDSHRVLDLTLSDHKWKRLDLKRSDLLKNKIITIVVSRTWNPKELGLSGDARDLGVAITFDNTGDTNASKNLLNQTSIFFANQWFRE